MTSFAAKGGIHHLIIDIPNEVSFLGLLVSGKVPKNASKSPLLKLCICICTTAVVQQTFERVPCCIAYYGFFNCHERIDSYEYLNLLATRRHIIGSICTINLERKKKNYTVGSASVGMETHSPLTQKASDLCYQ